MLMARNDPFLLENLQGDLSQDILCILDEVSGKDSLEDEKQDLLNSVLFLFRNQLKEMESINNQMNSPPNFSNPLINIYYVNQPLNSPAFPSDFYNQPTMQPAQYSNPYLNTPQSQPQINQPQPFQTPNIYSPIPNGPSEKVSKKSKHKSKHHEKKDKKSKDKKDKKSNTKIMNFECQTPPSFNGIFNYLASKSSGNIHDNGTIDVSSNSINRVSSHPKNLLQMNGNYVAKSGEKNAWVLFDFKNMEVEISDYIVKASSTCCMKNWVLEVSNDKSNWTVIDSHSNCNDLKTPNTIAKYHVQNKSFAKFVRIRHNGPFIDYFQSNVMIINRVEFFGRLRCPI